MNLDLQKCLGDYLKIEKEKLAIAEAIVEKVVDFETVPLPFSETLDEAFLLSLPDKQVLYFITISDLGKINNLQNLEKRLVNRKKNSSYKMPAINSNNFIEGNSVLYVGKSSTGFRSRIKQHLGFSSKSTYSLQLLQWLEVQDLASIELKLHFVDFSKELTNVNSPNEILEIIESSVHFKFKPLLGRSGH